MNRRLHLKAAAKTDSYDDGSYDEEYYDDGSYDEEYYDEGYYEEY